MTKTTLASLVVASAMLSFAIAAQPARSADAPSISSLSPTIGPRGILVLVQGEGFLGSNTVDWGFGRQHNVSPTGPTDSTLGVLLRTQCPDSETNPCDDAPSQGYIDITVSNVNGTSNSASFLVAPHGSSAGGNCYAVDNFDAPVSIELLDSCTDPRCNAGACEEPTVTPSPSPSTLPAASPTPKASPSPSPSSSDDDDDDDDDDSSSGSGSSGSGSSGSSSSGSVAGTSRSAALRRGPSAADKAAKDFIQNKDVVATVQAFYQGVYRKPISFCASHYWKIRARSDKATRSKLLGAMRWQRQHGKDPIFLSCKQGRVAGATTKAASSGNSKITHKDINRLFRQVNNGQNPTPELNRFWISRLKDKPTASAMLGAMQWHKLNK